VRDHYCLREVPFRKYGFSLALGKIKKGKI
jgi:hypothetical protein